MRKVIAAVIFVVLVFITLAARGLGRWLVLEDPLARAQTIVVLNGSFPYRANEAAFLYRQEWAPEIWLTLVPTDAGQAAHHRAGDVVDVGTRSNARLLERLGVPARAVLVVEEGVGNTAEELRLVARALRCRGLDRVIVVTSKWHTRRTRIIWRTLVGDSIHAIVRYADAEPFDPDSWWRRLTDARMVAHEIGGLLNVWTGFPVQRSRPGAEEADGADPKCPPVTTWAREAPG
jgi:uncharacterized SAM-binding protein YcdF (DUF218 family)